MLDAIMRKIADEHDRAELILSAYGLHITEGPNGSLNLHIPKSEDAHPWRPGVLLDPYGLQQLGRLLIEAANVADEYTSAEHLPERRSSISRR